MHLPHSEDKQAKQGVDACVCMRTGERLELMNEVFEPHALLLPPTGVTFMMCKGEVSGPRTARPHTCLKYLVVHNMYSLALVTPLARSLLHLRIDPPPHRSIALQGYSPERTPPKSSSLRSLKGTKGWRVKKLREAAAAVAVVAAVADKWCFTRS